MTERNSESILPEILLTHRTDGGNRKFNRYFHMTQSISGFLNGCLSWEIVAKNVFIWQDLDHDKLQNQIVNGSNIKYQNTPPGPSENT